MSELSVEGVRHLGNALTEAPTPFDHKARHVELHNALDELVADLLLHTNKLPSKTTVMELMQWSYEQTLNPTDGRRE